MASVTSRSLVVVPVTSTPLPSTTAPQQQPQPTSSRRPNSTSRRRTNTSTPTPSTTGIQISIKDKETKVLSTPLIIVLAIVGVIIVASAIGFIICWARRKPKRPVPVLPPAGGTYWNNGFKHTASSRGYEDDDKERQYLDDSSLTPPSRAGDRRSSGASTPTQGLLRTLESSPSSPAFMKPFASHSDQASSASLPSVVSSGDRPVSNPPPPHASRYSDIPIPPVPDRPWAGHGHSHSPSRLSMASTAYSIHSSQAQHVRTSSRQSYFVDPSVHSGPTPVRPISVRGAPHKTGIQIILPHPLAPAVQSYATSSPDLLLNNYEPPAPATDRSTKRHSSHALLQGVGEGPFATPNMPSSFRPRETRRMSKRSVELLSPVAQSPTVEEPPSYFPPSAFRSANALAMTPSDSHSTTHTLPSHQSNTPVDTPLMTPQDSTQLTEPFKTNSSKSNAL